MKKVRKQQKNLKEQYYTDPDIAKDLIDYFNEKVGFKNFKIVIEPSAGNGSFLNNIPRNRSRKTIGLDLKPKNNKIKKQDFLTWKFPYKNISSDKVLCIGNPPFGLQSSLAKKFIRKCAEFSDHIAFILPISFNSEAFKKSIPKGFNKQWSITLDNDIFVDPQGYIFPQSLKTMFIYYQKDGKKPKRQKIVKPNGLWEFMTSTSSSERSRSDFRILRVSGTPGRAISRKSDKFYFSGKTFQNNYYIRILSPIKRDRNAILQDINRYQSQKKWKFNNTTTFKSIDKQQLIKVMNKITEKYIS